MSVLTGALLGDEDGATGIDRRAPCKANLRVAGRFLGLFASNRLHFYFPGQLDTRTSKRRNDWPRPRAKNWQGP
jgi:hypothetical protein